MSRRTGTSSASSVGYAFALAFALHSSGAAAQNQPAATPETRQLAAASYQSGVRAFESGDFRAAAEFFETADRTLPAAQAAIYAIRAHRGINTPAANARAGSIALRLLSRYPTDTRVTGYAYRVVDEMAPTLGRLAVRCQGCDLSLDDQSSETEVFVPSGFHVLVAAWGTRTLRREVEVPIGVTTTLQLAPPSTEVPTAPAVVAPVAPAVAPTPPGATSVAQPVVSSTDPQDPPSDRPVTRPSGLSPAVFLTGMAITLGLAGAVVWSGIDTLDGRDQYVRTPTQQGLDDGRSRELRTNALIGVTAGVGVVSAVVGLFFTRWRSRVTVTPNRWATGQGLSLQGSF